MAKVFTFAIFLPKNITFAVKSLTIFHTVTIQLLLETRVPLNLVDIWIIYRY